MFRSIWIKSSLSFGSLQKAVCCLLSDLTSRCFFHGALSSIRTDIKSWRIGPIVKIRFWGIRMRKMNSNCLFVMCPCADRWITTSGVCRLKCGVNTEECKCPECCLKIIQLVSRRPRVPTLCLSICSTCGQRGSRSGRASNQKLSSVSGTLYVFSWYIGTCPKDYLPKFEWNLRLSCIALLIQRCS